MDAASGKKFSVVNPTTEEVICEVAEGDKVCKVFPYMLSKFQRTYVQQENCIDFLNMHNRKM